MPTDRSTPAMSTPLIRAPLTAYDRRRGPDVRPRGCWRPTVTAQVTLSHAAVLTRTRSDISTAPPSLVGIRRTNQQTTSIAVSRASAETPTPARDRQRLRAPRSTTYGPRNEGIPHHTLHLAVRRGSSVRARPLRRARRPGGCSTLSPRPYQAQTQPSCTCSCQTQPLSRDARATASRSRSR